MHWNGLDLLRLYGVVFDDLARLYQQKWGSKPLFTWFEWKYWISTYIYIYIYIGRLFHDNWSHSMAEYHHSITIQWINTQPILNDTQGISSITFQWQSSGIVLCQCSSTVPYLLHNICQLKMPILRLISLKSWHIYVEMSVGVACHISESSMAFEQSEENTLYIIRSSPPPKSWQRWSRT